MTLAILAIATACLLGFSFFAARRIERLWPPRGERIAVGGKHVHLMRREPQGAPRGDVVLIHGASGNCRDMILPLGELLAARGFRVVAVDRPGHGYSDKLADDASSPADQARILRAALEKAGVARALVVGHSWAGSIAVNFLLDHADFCEAALLVAPVTHPWPGGVRWYYKLAATPVVGWPFAHLVVPPLGLLLMKPSIAGVFAPTPAPPNYAERIGAALALRPEVFRCNARDVAHLRAFLEEQAPRMGAIARPVAIVSGDRDGVVLTERHSYGSARDIPGATLTMLKGVGHSPHWADAPTVAAEIETLFARAQSERDTRPDMPSSAPGTSSQ